MLNAPVTMTVEAAQQALLQHVQPGPTTHIPLHEALGRTLAEPVAAQEDHPPFANSAMDGYAVQSADVAAARASAPVTLQVIERLAAGHLAAQTVRPGTAIRIMTGAQMPDGADTVVPFEDTDEVRGGQPDTVQIEAAHSRGAHVRPAGEDIRSGTLALEAGIRLGSSQIGLLAALGRASIMVFQRPRVAVLATGDELIAIDQPLTPGKIRNVNSHVNAAQVQAVGGEPLVLPVAGDSEEAVWEQLHAAVDWGAELILTSGGVSVGDHDIIRKLLMDAGAVEFWRVRMRPGKPVMFGTLLGTPVLGLPGNPVSAMVTFELFARPALRRMAGLATVFRPTCIATLQESALECGPRRQFVRAQLRETATGRIVVPATRQGSHLVTAMAWANSLIDIPEGAGAIEPGSSVMVIPLDEAPGLIN